MPKENKKKVATKSKHSIKSSINSEFSESDNNFSDSDNNKNNSNVLSSKNVSSSNAVVSSSDDKSNSKLKKNEKSDNTIKDIKTKAKEDFIQNDFFEKIIKYVKTDNLIRNETKDFREKMKTLKEQKEDLEKFILRFLELQEENVININGSGKLTKYESVRKKGINKDIIEQAISDQLKKEKLFTDEKKIKELVEATYKIMEDKREKTVKTVLKRTFIREKKPKSKKETKPNGNEIVGNEIVNDEKLQKIKKKKNN